MKSIVRIAAVVLAVLGFAVAIPTTAQAQPQGGAHNAGCSKWIPVPGLPRGHNLEYGNYRICSSSNTASNIYGYFTLYNDEKYDRHHHNVTFYYQVNIRVNGVDHMQPVAKVTGYNNALLIAGTAALTNSVTHCAKGTVVFPIVRVTRKGHPWALDSKHKPIWAGGHQFTCA